MRDSIEEIIRRAISPSRVRLNGRLTYPLSYGVYALPANCLATRRYRFGNYPVRMQELEKEFGICKLEHLFVSRADAIALALMLNAQKA
jgi:hypothetical protein